MGKTSKNQAKTKRGKGQNSGSWLNAINPKTLNKIRSEFVHSYTKNTPKKVKLLDTFCVFCMAVTMIQIGYMLVVGAMYKNMLYAGCFTSFGSAVLTGSLP